MLNEQLNLLYPLVAIFLATTVFVLYVYYSSARHYRLKLLLGPALLAACVFTVPTVGAKLGYGWPAPLPESFQYIAHRTVVVGGEKQWIDVMVLSRKPLRTDARLHRIRHTGKLEQVLEEAQRMKEGQGGGEIVVTGPGSAGGSNDAGYSASRVLPQDEFRKGAPPPRALPRDGLREAPRPPRTDRPDYLT
jgi:hypothetical protein